MESKRAFTYARQSLTAADERDDSLSIAAQVRACSEYIARQGWTLAGTYDDPDTRGWRVSRPAFDQMLAHLREGRADVIVIFKLSRFMRSLMDQERFVGEIAAAGGELVSVMEPYISTSPMVRQILGAVNEQYKRDQAEFLRAAWRERAERGIHHGGAPYGYRMDDGRLAVDEPAASTVRQMFAWAREGHGSPEIAARLNAAGIATPRAGERWYEERVLRLLRRPVYCGRIALNGEIVTEDGVHEPLVAPEVFDAVQALLARRSGIRRKAAPSWLDGFVVHACGRRMYAARHHDGREDRGWRYRCGGTMPNRATAARCAVRPGSMMVGKIEDAALRLLGDAVAEITPPEAVAAHLEAQHAATDAERGAERRRLERRIQAVTTQRDRLLDMALRGTVAEDAYQPRDAALRAEIEQLRAELAAVPGSVDRDALAITHATLQDARVELDVAALHEPELLPGILAALDARVVIGDGPIRLRFGGAVGAFLRGQNCSS